MTADEIREHVARLADWHKTEEQPVDLNAAQAGALWEIAAQLAELNHRLSAAGQADAEQLAAQIRGRSTQAHDRG